MAAPSSLRALTAPRLSRADTGNSVRRSSPISVLGGDPTEAQNQIACRAAALAVWIISPFLIQQAFGDEHIDLRFA
jgi:hypothetical protein